MNGSNHAKILEMVDMFLSTLVIQLWIVSTFSTFSISLSPVEIKDELTSSNFCSLPSMALDLIYNVQQTQITIMKSPPQLKGS